MFFPNSKCTIKMKMPFGKSDAGIKVAEKIK
jgi:hypothetical protein